MHMPFKQNIHTAPNQQIPVLTLEAGIQKCTTLHLATVIQLSCVSSHQSDNASLAIYEWWAALDEHGHSPYEGDVDEDCDQGGDVDREEAIAQQAHGLRSAKPD